MERRKRAEQPFSEAPHRPALRDAERAPHEHRAHRVGAGAVETGPREQVVHDGELRARSVCLDVAGLQAVVQRDGGAVRRLVRVHGEPRARGDLRGVRHEVGARREHEGLGEVALRELLQPPLQLHGGGGGDAVVAARGHAWQEGAERDGLHAAAGEAGVHPHAHEVAADVERADVPDAPRLLQLRIQIALDGAAGLEPAEPPGLHPRGAAHAHEAEGRVEAARPVSHHHASSKTASVMLTETSTFLYGTPLEKLHDAAHSARPPYASRNQHV